MIAQALVREHHIESLDHLHAYGQLSVDTFQQMTALTLQHVRDTLGTHAARTRGLLDGEQPSPVQLDHAVGLLQRTTQLFTDSYQKWVALLEAQMSTIHRTTHATYADLQRWSPAGTEILVETAELMSNAAEKVATIAAESGADMAKAVESTAVATTAEPAPRKTPVRRTAARKTA